MVSVYDLKTYKPKSTDKFYFDYENKRLIGKKYCLQWVNRGTNSVGQVFLGKNN